MLELIIAQSESLSADWVKYIVGGLALAVVSMAVFLKWIITTILNKAEEGLKNTWAEAKDMHKGAMDRFDQSLAVSTENRTTLRGMESDIKEIKYSQLNMSKESENFKCQKPKENT